MATMKDRLSGKTILITGASSGIGASTAIEFAQTSPENLRLVLAARRVDRLTELNAKITTSFPGVKVHIAQLDVSKPNEIKKFVGTLPEEFQDIDVLVNNAYVSQALCEIAADRIVVVWRREQHKLQISQIQISQPCGTQT